MASQAQSLAADQPRSGVFFVVLAAVLLGLGWGLLGRRMLAMAPRDLGLTLVIGASMACYQVSFFAAIERVGVAVALLLGAIVALTGPQRP